MRFPRKEYCSGLPFPSPGDLPHPGIKPTSPALAGRFFTTEPPGKSYNTIFFVFFTPWVWLSRTVISACMWRCVGLSMRKMCSDLSPQGEVNQNCLPSWSCPAGKKGLSQQTLWDSEAQFIKITLQVPHGTDAVTSHLFLLLTPLVRLDKHSH